MPRVAIEDNNRMSLRVRAPEKAQLLRAAALSQTDLTDFVISHAVLAARNVIAAAENLKLSDRDSLHVLDLLENLPEPNGRLIAAARSLPDRQ
jgi:uncharacterized protein (DUF1778 family)